jgi:hypothetical protein
MVPARFFAGNVFKRLVDISQAGLEELTGLRSPLRE